MCWCAVKKLLTHSPVEVTCFCYSSGHPYLSCFGWHEVKEKQPDVCVTAYDDQPVSIFTDCLTCMHTSKQQRAAVTSGICPHFWFSNFSLLWTGITQHIIPSLPFSVISLCRCRTAAFIPVSSYRCCWSNISAVRGEMTTATWGAHVGNAYKTTINKSVLMVSDLLWPLINFTS